MKKLFLLGMAATGALWAQPAVVDLYSANGYNTSPGAGRFFFAWFCGTLLAFSFEWLFAGLSLATGITAAKSISRRGRSVDRGRSEKESGEQTVRKVETAAGIWGLCATCVSLFFACWIAIETVRGASRWECAALGLAIWAANFLGAMSIEALALGSVLSTISGLIKTAGKAALAPVQALASGVGQAASESASKIASKVREEFQESGGSEGVKQKFQSYLKGMPARGIDRSSIESGSEKLFEGDIAPSAREGLLKPLDRSKFEEMVSARGDITREEAHEVAGALHERWNRAVREGRPETVGPAAPASASATISRMGDPFPDMSVPSESGEGFAAQAGNTRVSPVTASRTQAFRDFLRNSEKRELNPARLEQEMELIMVGGEGNPSERGVRDLNREDMVSVLRQRRDITLQEADSIADLIDAARARLLSRSERQEHRAQEAMNEALSKVRDFVYSLKRPEPDYEGVKDDLAQLFSDPKAGLESLKQRVSGLDREAAIDMLTKRGNLSREEAERLAAKAEEARAQAVEKAEKIEAETQRRLEAGRRKVEATAEATQRAAATAAWWLCAIGVCSAAASALGGLTGRM